VPLNARCLGNSRCNCLAKARTFLQVWSVNPILPSTYFRTACMHALPLGMVQRTGNINACTRKEVNLAGQVDPLFWGCRLSRATPAEMSEETCAFLCTRSLIILCKKQRIAIDSGLRLCDLLTFLSARLSQATYSSSLNKNVVNMRIIPT